MDLLTEFGLPRSGTQAQRPLNASQGAIFFNSGTGALEAFDELHSTAGGWHAAGGSVAVEVEFAEEGAAGVYTGSVAIPAGATIQDIVVHGTALWGAGSSATMIVGDAADNDGYFTGVNLKATDLLAGESISFDNAGGKAGAYIAGSQVNQRYSATARTISGIVTTVGTASSTGRTRMTVIYTLPRVRTATKVAS